MHMFPISEKYSEIDSEGKWTAEISSKWTVEIDSENRQQIEMDSRNTAFYLIRTLPPKKNF